MVKVIVDGEVKTCEKGTTYLQIAKDFQQNYEHDIILAKRGGEAVRTEQKGS